MSDVPQLSLMIPGPAELLPADLAALGQQTVPHYGEWWSATYRGLLDDLALLLGADEVYALPGSGSAGLEVAMANLFPAGARVAVPDTGFFGARLAEMAEALGLRATLIPQPLDRPVDPAELERHLQNADGLLAVHVDSTTGIVHPIEEMARRARAAGATVVVDAIASAGGERISLRGTGIDALVTATQKGLAAPPGLAIVALGERAVLHRPKSWYFDLARWQEARAEDEWEPHPVTMPTAIVRALLGSVARILASGVDAWVADRHELATGLRKQLRAAGLEPFAPEDCAASLVTVVRCDEPAVLARRAREAGIMLGLGLPPLTGAVRIGLLGNTATQASVDRVVTALAGHATFRNTPFPNNQHEETNP
jgi:alanine-glyoxylate transaminase/serine-glyoxylate transaminase/serine-pyruvate transaminase